MQILTRLTSVLSGEHERSEGSCKREVTAASSPRVSNSATSVSKVAALVLTKFGSVAQCS